MKKRFILGIDPGDLDL